MSGAGIHGSTSGLLKEMRVMTLIFDAIFSPCKLEGKRRVDGMIAVVVIYVLFLVTLHDVLRIHAHDWKLVLLGFVGFLFYVYGSAGINMIMFRFRDYFGYVSCFPGVFVPYIFVPPLYLFFSSPSWYEPLLLSLYPPSLSLY